jgi:hypothetical protein
MRAALLGLAASVAAIPVLTSPAAAQAVAGAGFTAGPAFTTVNHGVTVHRGGSATFRSGQSGSNDRFGRHWRGPDDGRDRRRHRGDAVFVGGWGYSDLDPTFGPTRGNDWWHERPNRSYPRWVHSNESCERVWQGGGTWRCEW